MGQTAIKLLQRKVLDCLAYPTWTSVVATFGQKKSTHHGNGLVMPNPL